MAEKFYTILTNIGKASVANASALGTKVDFKFMALGDGNGNYYNPTEIQTQLVNEVYRSQMNHVQLDDENDNWITLSMVIPSSVGGFTVREVGVFDTEENLLAIGKYPETYKPILADGSSKDLTINMILEVSNTDTVTIKVDPSVVLATKKYVDNLAGVGRTIETVKGNADAIVGIKNGTVEVPDLETIDKTLKGAINELDGKVKSHEADMIHQEEVHGIRLNIDKKLEYFDGEEWVEVKGGGGSTVPLGNLVNFTAEGGDAQVVLKWQDPEDIIVEGIIISKWGGTKVVRKVGSYPANHNDGTVVVDSATRNQYKVNGFIDDELTNDVEVFYMAFPYTVDGLYTNSEENRVSATPTEIDPNSWAGIQAIVRKGLANDHFAVGDQIMSNYDGDEIIWEVIGIDIDTPADPSLTHSMTLQTKDCLHDIQFDAPEPSNPDSNRKTYGNNRYIHSALRQWLNSDEATFIWQSQHQYDAKPTANPELYNGAGFLNRLDPELKGVLGAVNKKVAKNTATDGGGQEEFADKVFLISPKEAGYIPSEMSNDGVYTGEFVYPFYDGKGNANRIKNLKLSPGTWWFRSPYVSASSRVRIVYTSGALNHNSAYLSYGLSPACTIV